MSNPAGWYPQPDGRQRYWDGQQWTDHFAPGAQRPVPTAATGGEPDRAPFQNEHIAPRSNPPATAPQSVQAPVQSTGSNGLAVAGFVLALIGVLISFIPIVNTFGDVLAIVGLILGIVGLVQSRSRKAGKGLSISAIILAVVALIISAVVDLAAVTVVNNAVKNLPTIAATPLTPTTTAKLGGTLTLNGTVAGNQAAVTAMNFVDPTTSTDGFSTPAAGNQYIAVQFQIQNTGSVSYFDAPVNAARVTDVTGRQFDATLVNSVAAGPVLPATVTLAPGQKATGYIVFEVPTSATVTTVQFAMDSGFAQSGQWTVR
jgi:hypothetical protein